MKDKRNLKIEELLEDLAFLKWARGEADKETQEWEFRYQTEPEIREVMDQARLLSEGIPFKKRFVSERKVDFAWEEMEKSIQKRASAAIRESRRRRLDFVKTAAAIILLLAAGLGLYVNYQNGEVVHHTLYGERMNIELSDGSVVFMNANSTLSYIRKNPRIVRVDGEAYFKVAKKPQTGEPFIVNTPDLKIRVLGTEFNVNSRDRKTEVLLDEGSVELDLAELGKMLMKPGDLVSYSIAEEQILEQKIAEKPEVITSWKEGVLLLDSVTLSETLTLLEQTYDVTAVLENEEIGDKILVGGVPNDDLETCIRALQTIYRLDIQLEENSLIIK